MTNRFGFDDIYYSYIIPNNLDCLIVSLSLDCDEQKKFCEYAKTTAPSMELRH